MADKSISELVAATAVGSTDLFVLEQSGAAKKLTGQILENWLVSFADGHGGISSWSYTPPVAPSLEGTLTLTLADTSEISVPIMNGAKGDTGAQTYVWIKWAAQNPTADNQLSDTPDAWIGIYTGTASSAPTSRTAYRWYQYKGATGETGAAVSNVAWTSNSGGAAQGTPGTTDTYTMYVGTTAVGTFTVYNGMNGSGAVSSVNGVNPDGSGNVSLSAADVGAMPSTYTAPVGSVNGLTGSVVINRVVSVTLSASWSGSGPYTQTVSLSNVSAKSKVDLQPNAAVVEQMVADGCLAIYIVNSGTTPVTLTAYAVGAAPSVALTMQATITEVS